MRPTRSLQRRPYSTLDCGGKARRDVRSGMRRRGLWWVSAAAALVSSIALVAACFVTIDTSRIGANDAASDAPSNDGTRGDDALAATDASPACPARELDDAGPVAIARAQDAPFVIAVDPAPCGAGSVFWATRWA